ncbi:MAG: cupredoxin domain-containing protein [Actinomycetota bacterium]
MSRVAWGILVPFCAVLALLAVVTIVRENTGGSEVAAAEQADTVKMAPTKFAPAEITVARGAVITFDNDDVAPHTVSADDGSTDSGIIDPGKAFELTVNDAFSYHCEIHPSMKASVRLEG